MDIFKTMCIRNRIILTFALLLAINAASIFFLGYRLERKLESQPPVHNDKLTYDVFLGMVLTGDIHQTSWLTDNYLTGGEANTTDMAGSLIVKLRKQMLAVFAGSMALGIFLSLRVSRGISDPIVKLARSAKTLANGGLDESVGALRCTELQMLADSLKKMRSELQEYEEEKSRLESVELTKNLAAGIAHEIKNPINTVGLILDYLQTNLSPDNPEKRYEFYKLAENMKSELKRINRIVEGFLRLTKPTVFNFSVGDINSLIRDTVSVLEPEIVKNGVSVRLELQDGLPTTAVDRDKLSQALSNLLINAIEAMPRGGDVTVATRILDGNVEISVSDNGVGIPDENIKKIFNPYFSTKKQGFGLGLSLVQDIVHKHGGKLSVQSTKGKGSDFTIQIPSDEANEQASARS